MTAISLPLNQTLGSNVQAFPKVQYAKIKELIDKVNALSTSSTNVNASTITPVTSGGGTSLIVPVIAGTAYASPTVLTASQSGAICLLNAAAGNVFTLPAATAANTGVRFRFIQTATVTSNASTIQGATSSDLFIAGSSITSGVNATPTITKYSPNGSSNYKVSCNGTTTGGIIGATFDVVCIGLNQWLVTGSMSATGTIATPFAG